MNIFCQFKEGSMKLLKSTVGRAMNIAHMADYSSPQNYLPMPYKYYEDMGLKACQLAEHVKTEEEKESVVAKYVDFIDGCMEEVDGNIVGELLKVRTGKSVVVISPPLFAEAKEQVIINDILLGKANDKAAPLLIRLYKMISLKNEGLWSKNCLYIIAGYSKDLSKKKEYLKIFQVPIYYIIGKSNQRNRKI